MLSLHILGGTRTQSPERHYADETFESCLVVETEDALYLLDCGNPASALLTDQFLGEGHKPIRGIFISHADPDHINGLWSLLAAENSRRTTEFVVALPLPEAELSRCREFLKLAAAPRPPKAAIRFVPMPKGYSFEEGAFRLETLPNGHLNPLRSMPDLTARPFVDYHPSFSFRVKYQDHGVAPRPDFGKSYVGKDGREIRWQPIPPREIRSQGGIGLDDLIGGFECLAYVHSRFTVEADGDYEILAGSDDGCRMWVDGREVFYLNQTKGTCADEYRIPISLQAGEHEVLMAVEQRFAAWMYFWRIRSV